MLYDPTRKFIFIHIWKTGGESVVAALRDQCPSYFRNRYLNKAIRVMPGPASMLMGWRARLVQGQHFTAQEIRNEMPDDAFDTAFKFAFVRNPWDWQVSNYAYALHTPAHGQHDVIQNLGSFDAYIRYQHAERAPSQSSFLDGNAGEELVDFVGRFETLQADFQTICAKIGVKAELPFLNASNRRKDWRSYYTDETRDLVADLFAQDIERFGYRWDE
ncbi:MAG: sulfotransferase family 2 domain-containing protein [Henriciella sp.]|nr:sulfotransferase family 2 domain-containing protein [Henriciella sp.]